jgi:hypothetical protein
MIRGVSISHDKLYGKWENAIFRHVEKVFTDLHRKPENFGLVTSSRQFSSSFWASMTPSHCKQLPDSNKPKKNGSICPFMKMRNKKCS